MRVLLAVIQIACLEGKIPFYWGNFNFIWKFFLRKNGILLFKNTLILSQKLCKTKILGKFFRLLTTLVILPTKFN